MVGVGETGDMTVYAIVALVAILGFMGWRAYRCGEDRARLKEALRSAEVRYEQIKAEHNRPAAGDIADRL